MCGCGVEKYGQRHDVHHIVPIISGGVHESELLLELCRACHERVEKFTSEIPEVTPLLVE
jgi:5-methylcytosine-specific restriction endonuclease McrA